METTPELAPLPRVAPPAYAAIDLGTNNCRLLIGTPTGSGFRVLDSFSRIVRLGEGLHDTNRLSEGAMERAMVALHVCAGRVARKPIRALRAIATEACRRADNGPEFLARVRRETGLPIEPIAPREEAELALESCATLLHGAGRRALLFDIGGGSTELAWIRLDPAGPQLIGFDSLPVGVVTLAERFGPAAYTERGFTAMVEDVTGRLASFERIHCIAREIQLDGVRLLGTSGTVTTLAGVALGLSRYSRALVDGTCLVGDAADAALMALRQMGRDGLAAHPCIGGDRAEFVLPGCAIFAAIRGFWPVRDVVVADRGLREGMLLRLMRTHDRRQSHSRPSAEAWPERRARAGAR